MTLIELFDAYARTVRLQGREEALKFLVGTCDESLHWHIINSVNDEGNFIDAEGKFFTIVQNRNAVKS
jgi:hypothetical protein